MKITLMLAGKTEDENLRALFSNYENRLKHYLSFQTIIIPELKNSKNLSTEQYKEKESELILKYLTNKEFVILLDEHGKEMGSKKFAQFLQQKMNQSVKEICFLTGGPYGVSDNIKKIVNFKLSLSEMTFTHQLIRVIFIEQLYRAMTILKNESYHNE